MITEREMAGAFPSSSVPMVGWLMETPGSDSCFRFRLE